MIENFDAARLASAQPGEMEELLESGNIIHFPACPIEQTEAEFGLRILETGQGHPFTGSSVVDEDSG